MKRINITCPVCGSKAYLRPASVVYGDKALDPAAKYYVCGRYPACDCYVAAHRKTMLPMGTLVDKALRKKRYDAHVALDSLSPLRLNPCRPQTEQNWNNGLAGGMVWHRS